MAVGGLVVSSFCVAGWAQGPLSNGSSESSSIVAAALPAGTPDDVVLTIRKRVDEVHVLFIATDRHGKFVRNLNQNDFTFFDDHKPV